MGEIKTLMFDVSGQKIEAGPDNCGISLFRDTPDLDYMDIWEKVGPDDSPEERHHWIFNNREKLIWIGGICVQDGDADILKRANRTKGSFFDQAGWRPAVMVEDRAADWEQKLYGDCVLGDTLSDDDHLYADLQKAMEEE